LNLSALGLPAAGGSPPERFRVVIGTGITRIDIYAFENIK